MLLLLLLRYLYLNMRAKEVLFIFCSGPNADPRPWPPIRTRLPPFQAHWMRAKLCGAAECPAMPDGRPVKAVLC